MHTSVLFGAVGTWQRRKADEGRERKGRRIRPKAGWFDGWEEDRAMRDEVAGYGEEKMDGWAATDLYST